MGPFRYLSNPSTVSPPLFAPGVSTTPGVGFVPYNITAPSVATGLSNETLDFIPAYWSGQLPCALTTGAHHGLDRYALNIAPCAAGRQWTRPHHEVNMGAVLELRAAI